MLLLRVLLLSYKNMQENFSTLSCNSMLFDFLFAEVNKELNQFKKQVQIQQVMLDGDEHLEETGI